MIMKKLPALIIASLALVQVASAAIVQEWNFTEDGAGLASKNSDQGLATGNFFADDPVASDGGLTVLLDGSNSSGDRALGIALNDSNALEVTFSVTLASFDFSNGAGESDFTVRLRNDATNTPVADLSFRRQDANDRIRILGEAVAGVAVGAESSNTPIT